MHSKQIVKRDGEKSAGSRNNLRDFTGFASAWIGKGVLEFCLDFWVDILNVDIGAIHQATEYRRRRSRLGKVRWWR